MAGSATVKLLDGKIEITMKYNKDMIDSIKSFIPCQDREWDPDNKVWVIASKHLAVVTQLMVKHQIRYIIVDSKTKKAKPSTDRDVLFVTSDAPQEVVKAAYKALCILYHPDRGGDPKKFIKMKEAYDNIIGD